MSEKGRLLALDYGSKTVGAAVCDPFHVTVSEVGIIRRESETHLRKTLRRIAELASEYEAKAIILGLPLNMDGSYGERARKTEEFRTLLIKRLGLPVILVDERLTTVEAEEILKGRGIKREHFREYIDMTAAAVILRDYLSREEEDTHDGHSDPYGR